jgi:Mrp family chromosome partitioning ATPase/capsular polysaccharide biosynthesis protein
MLDMRHPLRPMPQHSALEPVYDWKWMAKALLRWWRAMLLIPAILMVLAAAYVALRPSTFTATAVLNITNLRLTASGQDTLFSESFFDPSFLDTQVQLVGSDPVLLAVIEKLGLGAAEGDRQAALKRFRDRFTVQQVRQSNLVQVSFSAPDPRQAALVANEIASTYIAKLNADREKAVQSASSWLRERMRAAGPQAQIISEAMPPIDKSDLRGILIIAAAAAVGGAIAMMLALVMSFLDRGIREPEEAQAATGVACLGIVPLLGGKAAAAGTDGKAQSPRRLFGSASAILSEVTNQPFSPLWQALRHAVVAGKTAGIRSIAVTSAVAGEGKTVIAANLALMASDGGKRVLLVDAQIYDPALSRLLAPTAVAGLASFLDAPGASLADQIRIDPQSGLHFLPFGQAQNRAATAQLLWSDRMGPLFAQLRDYDLVVFDMPPLVATGDLRASAAQVDAFLLVVEWGKTTGEQLGAALAAVTPIHDRLVGTIINKADPRIADRVFSSETASMARRSSLAHRVERGDAG